MRFLRRFFYKMIRKSPADMDMVQYWKFKESIAAKVTRDKHGSLIMKMEGEKEPFPGYPRGHLLFGPLSKLKHEIKNQVFNDSWWKLEAGTPKAEVIAAIKDKLFGEIAAIAELSRYDMVPPNRMSLAVREIHRAWTEIAPEKTYPLRDYLCFILNEDDAYRFRVSWLVSWFGWFAKWNPVKTFDYALSMLEHGEIVGDMKERQRLLRRIVMLLMEDTKIRELFIKFFREVNWNKVKLTKADKYHFRGKYFKVDLDVMEY